MSKQDLQLGYCTHEAARFAVRHWYHRPEMPIGRLVKIGVWYRDEFSGVLIFGRGASDSLGKRWGLTPLEVCELCRVALKPGHEFQVSRVLRVGVRLMRDVSPNIRAVVTFAEREHHGGIYQAAGWVYTGLTAPDRRYVDASGVSHHSRGVSRSGWRKGIGGMYRCVRTTDCEAILVPGKHRFVLPLDNEMRERVQLFARPAPARGELAPEA